MAACARWMNYINPNDDPSLPKFSDIRDTTRRFVILLAVLGLLALVGLLGGKPVYRWFKTQRALSMVEQGEAAIANGDWDTTGRMVQTSLKLAPNSPEVLRLAARYCTQKTLAQGLNYWQSVEAMTGLTLDDQYDYARLSLSLGRTDLSANLLTALIVTNQSDPKVLRLVTMHSTAVGNLPDAVRSARAWLRAATTDPDAELTLGGLLFGSAEPQERREGRGLLWGLALGGSQHRWIAVETLAASPELSRGENQVLLNLVENNTNQLATAFALRVKLHPDRKAELIDQMIAEVVADGSPRQLAVAAAWLADNGEIRRVLDVLPLKVAEKQPTLMTARLQALMELGEMEEVKRFLEMDTSKVETFLLHCLRAYAAQQENKPQLVAGHFESALAAADRQPARLRFVAGYAERIGQPQAAIAAYRRLMNWPPATVDAGKRILQLATQLNDTRAVRDTIRQLAAFMPGERGIAMSNAYLGALLNDVTARSKADLLRFADREPMDPELAFVLAFVEWRLGEAPQALSRLESLKPEWLRAEPRRQVVYAAVLGANDQREAARRLARTVEVTTLRPEEVELVKQWRE